MPDLLPEVVVDGRKQIPGTTVEREASAFQRDESVIVRHPSGSEIHILPSQTVSVDGFVIAGPMKGWKVEQRPVGNDGRLLREIFFKGAHGRFCDLTGDGWVCREGCTLQDARMQPDQLTVLDTLIEIVHVIERRRLRVEWELIRVSQAKKFHNGRCRIPGSFSIERRVWHSGRTWTKWGARRKMRTLAKPPE